MGSHCDSELTSFFRLVSKLSQQLSASRVQDGFREMTPHHPGNVQLLQSDQVIILDEPLRDLMTEISASVAQPLVGSRQGQARSLAIPRPTLLASQEALPAPNLLFASLRPSRILDHWAIRKGGGRLHSQINTHSSDHRPLLWRRADVAGDTGSPASARTHHRQMAGSAAQRPMPAQTKAAQLGNEDVSTFPPKRGSRQGKGVVALARAKARIARSLARLDSAEERLESTMDAAQGLSCEFNRKGAHGLVFPAKFSQLLRWLEVTNPFPMRSPSARAFFERRIVEFRAKAEKVVPPPLLAARGHQGALEGSYHDAEF
jgi:hypothetical protein